MKWVVRVVFVIGVWTMLSPWLVPFLGISQTWNGVFSGAIVIICGLWWLADKNLQAETKL
ncbi:SPW repeat protein [Patescibacteria group bacterium]|nr:SPW repeat protein [Patescibacteria group bacterium]